MEKVTIAFNRQLMHPTAGTYYRGCFTLSRPLYERFVGQKRTTNTEHYLKSSETKKLIRFLRFCRIPFHEKRANGEFNYYIRIVEESTRRAS